MVSLHVWSRIILSHHGVVFAGLLHNTARLTSKTSCSCFIITPVTTVTPVYDCEDEEPIVLDTSGPLFDNMEVLIKLKIYK